MDWYNNKYILEKNKEFTTFLHTFEDDYKRDYLGKSIFDSYKNDYEYVNNAVNDYIKLNILIGKLDNNDNSVITTNLLNNIQNLKEYYSKENLKAVYDFDKSIFVDDELKSTVILNESDILSNSRKSIQPITPISKFSFHQVPLSIDIPIHSQINLLATPLDMDRIKLILNQIPEDGAIDFQIQLKVLIFIIGIW